MDEKSKNTYYFQGSHLVVLFCYTLFSVILIGESLLLGWEKWALILIAIAVSACWIIHIRQILSIAARIWVYASLMMATAYFYGIHATSTYDLALIISVIMIIFVSTGIPGLITLCQVTYYLTLPYDLFQLYKSGETIDSLFITRTMLHIAVVTVMSFIVRGFIRRWIGVINESDEEKAKLKDAADRLNDFLANISHEIRTPINAVMGLSSVCIEKVDDKEVKDDLSLIFESGKNVSDQISDILDYSEIDMESLTVNNSDYMISSVLNDLVSQISPKRLENIELVIDVEPSIPYILNSDEVKIRRILKHLIDNGIKYTPKGGVYVRITCEPRDYGINLLIEVTDTGIGMSPQEVERSYERFYQANSGRDRSNSGLGLGLSIVNGFVKALNGFMIIESAVGEGTTVRVSLPQTVTDSAGCMNVNPGKTPEIGSYLHFEKYDNPLVREAYNKMTINMTLGLKQTMQRADNLEAFKKLAGLSHFTHVILGREEYEEDPSYFDELSKTTLVAVVADASFTPSEGSDVRVMKKPFYCFPVVSFLNADINDEVKEEGRLYCPGAKALVVDDEPMNHMVAKSILSSYEMEVVAVSSGFEAVEFIQRDMVDIIFMDHMMPGMDGVETAKRIRAELGKQKKEVPIVALTANAVSSAKEMFIREGFDGFIAKPIEIPELERVLKRLLPKSVIQIAGNKDIAVEEAKKEAQKPEASKETEELFAETDPEKETVIDKATGLNYCQGDEELYYQILEEYAGDFEGRMSDLSSYLENGDFTNYEIIIHSVKSTSRMIGAGALADEAYELEKAAGAGDEEKILSLHDKTMKDYKKIAKEACEILGKKNDFDTDFESDGIFEFDPQGGE